MRAPVSAANAIQGMVLALVVGIVGYLVLSSVIGDSGKYVVNASFKDAGGILKNYNVKVGNVAAGTVERIALDEDDTVQVRMELDEEVGTIGEGATARVRPVNLLGEKYVDLDVGDTSKPLPSGSSIPIERTGAPTELDDVLNILDPDTRAGLRILINEAGIALGGRGADFNAVLDELPPALDEAEKVVGEVADENESLERLIVRGDRVASAMNAKRDDLGELVESAGNALDTVADQREDLGATLRSAPGGLNRLTSTLNTLQGAAQQLTPAARDLKETAPSLASTLSRTPAFAKDAKATLAAVDDVAPKLRRLGRQSTPTLERLQPTVDRLAQFSNDSRPLLDSLDQGRALREMLDFMDGWAGVIENSDGLGHIFRVRFTFDDEFFSSALQRYSNEFLDKPKKGKSRSEKAPEPEPRTEGAPPLPPLPDRDTPSELDLDRLTKTLTENLGKTTEQLKRLPEETMKQLQALPKHLTDELKGTLDGLKLGDRQPSGRDNARVGTLIDYLLGP